MEDLPARKARLGLVRPASASLVVQVRGHGLLSALALTGFAVALLSQLDTVEANAYEKSPLRSGVEVEREDLQQRQVTKGALLSPVRRYGRDMTSSETVKCVYFMEWPPHTYCHLENVNSVYAIYVVEDYCRYFGMEPISVATTPMYRLCRLIRHFGIEDHRLWVKDILHQPDTLGWEDCYFRTENDTQPHADCDTCRLSVICEAQFYHSHGPRCVTTTDGGSDVEYCYENDKANATEASERCAQHSSTLIDTTYVNREILHALTGHYDIGTEYWVDLKKEDVSQLSGVVSVNFTDIDWTSSCTTVWITLGEPWFFVRNCSDGYRVICQPNDTRTHPWRHEILDCDVREPYTRHCSAGVRLLNRTAASEYCANHSLSLLSGKMFHELFLDLIYFLEIIFQDRIFWDARSVSSRQKNSDTCVAVEIDIRRGEPEEIPQKCSKELDYICRKEKPRATHGFDCEEASMALWGRRPVCVGNVGRNFPESVKECAKLGMDLLPSGLEQKEYADIVNDYFIMYLVPRPNSALWVDVPERINDQSCSIMSDWQNFTLNPARCEDSVGSTVCVFSNKRTAP